MQIQVINFFKNWTKIKKCLKKYQEVKTLIVRNIQIMSVEEYNYWLKTKSAYEHNLKNNIGHLESIKVLISKIDDKLSSAVVRFN